ncbi:cytochrome c oxidase, subunit VIa [Globomyces pollinis-pini]|nr:cytochrome c oxidase, subunit VIa [Globomyces pollinis-pini]KAJ2995412.1 Cytochrome c oxidase subunit 6A1, mitochondrial [Globomyces sp. JEL0801]
MSFRLGLRLRNYSSAVKQFPSYEQTMTKKAFEHRLHAKSSTNMWFWLNVFITTPILLATAVYTVPPEVKHLHHLQEHPREFVAYPYMRKRAKQYPWGDDCLFYNPLTNPGPATDEE